MRIFLSAGETSGDLLGASLIRHLRERVPGIRIEGLGGPAMVQAGLHCHHDLTRHAIMGVLPVLRHAPALWRLIREVRRRFERDPPDAFVPIDYPGLHFVLARHARRQGVPVFYYVAPQLWAWASWRARKVRRRVDHLLSILPFEEAFFEARGVPTTYVGHPLVDRLHGREFDPAVVRSVRGDEGAPVLGLLPGSRTQEVRRLLPVMLRVAASLVARHPGLRVVVPAPGRDSERGRLVRELLDTDPTPALRVGDEPHAVMKHADAVLVASGTATAELAWLGTPMVILYRLGPVARRIAPHVVRVPHIGMANILAGERIVPEFLFSEPPYVEIERATEGLLLPGEERDRARRDLARVRHDLGPPGASARAAEALLDLLAARGISTEDRRRTGGKG